MDEDERLRQQRVKERAIAEWAHQTITCAVGLRAKQSGRSFEDREEIEFAQMEIDARTKELWEEVLSERPTNALHRDVIEAYASKVFDWCHSHMNPES